MKIRIGFVSNSSSSSFIIEIKPSIPCKCCGRIDQNILDLITNNDDNSVEAKGKQEVLSAISGWIDDKNIIDKIKNSKEEMAMVSVSNHDETLIEILKNSKNIKIIYCDE